jgi:asparagine synthase (glutamine-hydrolysing)
MDFKPYWVLPNIRENDKIPFDAAAKRQLHDLIVEAVLSQTLSDVPIGITLSGGIDSSIVTGILSSYYDKQIHIFTAQSPNSNFDETRYVDAVINKWNNPRFVVHRKNLNALSVKEDLVKYINIQEEPFGDPSIIAHGFLMQMAAEAGIKVILNGQGADEIFFGYNNMAQAILPGQFKALQFARFYNNLKAMKLGKSFMMRALLQSTLPDLENRLRIKSRLARRGHILPTLLDGVEDSMVKMYSYENLYNVWSESVYGVHLPHLVQYDDRNGMAYSIEGRMPFLDHRIAEFVATIKPVAFLKNGLRKYILREACKQYMPDEVYKRTDKIGFFTPLADSLMRDSDWVAPHFKDVPFIKPEFHQNLLKILLEKKLDTPNALHIWRQLSVSLWMKEFNVA